MAVKAEADSRRLGYRRIADVAVWLRLGSYDCRKKLRPDRAIGSCRVDATRGRLWNRLGLRVWRGCTGANCGVSAGTRGNCEHGESKRNE
jgi:hypothetical protein